MIAPWNYLIRFKIYWLEPFGMSIEDGIKVTRQNRVTMMLMIYIYGDFWQDLNKIRKIWYYYSLWFIEHLKIKGV